MKDIYLIEYCEDLKSKVHALSTVDVSHCCNKQLYVASEMNLETIPRFTGKVRETRRRAYNSQLVASFRHRTSTVHTISTLSSDEAWIKYYQAKKFELSQQDGHRIKIVAKHSRRHCFVLQNGSFLLCNEYHMNILKVDMSGKKSTWKDTSPLLRYWMVRNNSKSYMSDAISVCLILGGSYITCCIVVYEPPISIHLS